jgi:hypothetical protein
MMRAAMNALPAILISLGLTACQKTDAPSAGPPPTPVAAVKTDTSPAYHPSMGDLMTMAIQPRHIKLGLAGKGKNWIYASYEADELKNAFSRVARTIPDYRNNDVAKTADTYMKAPIEDLKTAIKNSDAKAFDVAYIEVTDGCNECHQALEHPAVKIRAPANAAAFSDQDFSAPTK